MVDNNEDAKRRAVVAFEERFDWLCNEVDKDYKELLFLSLSLEEILKKIEEYTFFHELQWKKLMNEIFIPQEIADRIDITKVRQEFNHHGHGLTLISNTINDIKNKTCDKCKNKLSKDSSYFFFNSKKTLVKWEINNIMQFSGWASEPTIIFCSEDCFKQTYYSRETKQNNNSKQQKSKNNLSQSETTENTSEPTERCEQCSKKLNPETDYLGLFCSEECYLKKYGTFCPRCDKYDTSAIYWDQEKYPDLTYCLDCYDQELKKKQEKEIKTQEVEQEQPNKYLFNKTHCKLCLTKLPNKKFLPVCDQDDCKKKFWEEGNKNKNNNPNLDHEQNRTEQPAGSNINQKSELTNQINNLKKEINQLEKRSFSGDQKSALNSQSRNLLENKKQELDNLEKKLKESNQKTEQRSEGSFEKPKVLQKDNSKLILGIGCGVLGLGLIGLIIYLVKRRKE